MQLFMTPPVLPTDSERRGFLKRAAAMAIGAVLGLVPFAAGLFTLIDPVRRKASSGRRVKVASLQALPGDGVPRKFPVISSRTDAWNKFPAVPIGAVYLRRTDEKTVEAFNVICPHAGCFVDLKPDATSYLCPCHNSTFALDGTVNDPRSPSPRGLDRLDTEILDGEVWVHFQNFRAGETVKIPEA